MAAGRLREHVVGDLLVFQSMQRGAEACQPVADDYAFSETQPFMRDDYPKLHFVERSYAGDPTNWWIPNRACSEAMLRSAGFGVIQRVESEVYLCQKRLLSAHERELIALPEVE